MILPGSIVDLGPWFRSDVWYPALYATGPMRYARNMLKLRTVARIDWIAWTSRSFRCLGSDWQTVRTSWAEALQKWLGSSSRMDRKRRSARQAEFLPLVVVITLMTAKELGPIEGQGT